MERRRRAIVLTVVLATLTIAAGPPVALRVETAAVRPEGDATVVSITVQVAPEDRARLGRDVWVQGELLRRGERVNRTARALDLDELGQAAFEVAWPPGDWELRVSIEGVSGKAAGIWVGRLAVPVMTAAAPSPAPAPIAMTAPAPAAAAVAAVEPTAMEPAPQPEVVAAAQAAAEPTPVEVPRVAAAATAAVAAVAAEQPAETVPPPQSESPPAVVPEPAAEPTPVEVPPVAAEQPAETVPAPQLEEVAPAELTPAPQPEVAAPAEAVHEPAVAPAPSQALAASPPAAAGPWATAHPGMAELTVLVTERNRPILGLDRSAFRLRVGGSPATVEAVGDEDSAPLNLAIVADLAADAEELADEIARQLGRFSLRTRDGGALLVATTAAPQPSWGAAPDDLLRWADGAASGRPDDLAGLVAAAAQSFADRRGRRFLVVVTDGSDSSGKAAWKEAAAKVEAAGVPVFVVGLRDSGFDDQARAALSRAADVTGGRCYFLGSAGMAGMTLDYVAELIDASYALAFRSPPSGPSPREAKVEVVNRDWQVHAPRRIP